MEFYTNIISPFFGSAQPGDSVAVCEPGPETDECLFGGIWSNPPHNKTFSAVPCIATRW